MRAKPTLPYQPHLPPGLVDRLRLRVNNFAGSFSSAATADFPLKRPTIWVTGERLYWGQAAEKATYGQHGYTDFVLDTESMSDGAMQTIGSKLFGKLLFNRRVAATTTSELVNVLIWSRDMAWRGENNHNELQRVIAFGKVARCVSKSLSHFLEHGNLD